MKNFSPSRGIRGLALSFRRHVALALCAVLLTSTILPASAQRRTAVRIPAGEATPTNAPPRKKERETQKERDARRAAAARRAKAQDGFLSYTPVSSDQETVGDPSTGEDGVQKTNNQIMAEQANYVSPRPPRVGKGILRKEKIDRSHLPQDPDAPLVARTGGDSETADGAPVRSGTRGTAQSGDDAPADDTPPAAPQTVSTPNFTGATLADTGAFPPDTMGAIGPTQFFVFTNGRLRTFNKTTGAADGVVNVDSDVFFSPVMTPFPAGGLNFTSDPNVRYDRLTRRWFLTIIDVPSTSPSSIGDIPNRLLIAVSDAASNGVISGSTVWTFYFVQQDTVGVALSTGEFLDYPSLGIDANALYVGGNMFGAVSGSFVNCTGFVIRKSSVLSGGPVVTTAFRGILPNGSSEGPFAPRGVDNYDPAATEGYFIGVSNAAFGRLITRRVFTPGGTPTISADIATTVASTSFPITVDHLGDTGGTNGNLDALDDRLFAAHIRNGRLWTSHNIAVLATGVSSGTNAARRNGVRWYELVVPVGAGAITVNQSGTIFDTAATVALARQYWIPTTMVSGQGHAVHGFSTAGTPYRIDAATNGRLRGDAAGTTGAVALYTTSSTAYNPPSDPGPPRRFGDYSFTSLDPKDDMTMWTIQEFCSGTNQYGVRVVRLLAPLPATPTTATPSTVAQNTPSTNVVVTGTSVAGSEFYDPGADIAGAEPFNHITATVSGGVTVNSVTYNTPTQVTLNVSTVGATLGPQTITVTNPDGQSMTGTATITVTTPLAPAATAGQVVISEFRFRGSAGATDEFTELYNTTNSSLDISGYTLQSVTAGLVHTVPGAIGSNTTVIPAHGHYLITGAGYSLAAVAASNGTQTGIGDASSIGFFAGTPATAANRIDSVGFNSTNPIYFEGTALTPATGITTNGEYSFIRKLTSGFPQDTNNNSNDFFFISTNGATYSTRPSILGAPSPENLTSPINRFFNITTQMLDPSQPASSAPNRVRDSNSYTDTLTPSSVTGVAPASSPYVLGTLSVRRRFVNNTGGPITRLRLRITDITTFPSPGAGVADIRALTSGTISVTVNNAATCSPNPAPCSLTVQGTTLEQPPTQAMGGGLNSTLNAGTVTLGSPLANGAPIDLHMLLGVAQSGSFRFFITVEALP
ncbi:MAG TPA: lamin tail domain-containing protein [Pyrinomonadaceae bacterium]|nr:lamin tail domain-containing protein [Pyrinomonadaceae bacterium]